MPKRKSVEATDSASKRQRTEDAALTTTSQLIGRMSAASPEPSGRGRKRKNTETADLASKRQRTEDRVLTALPSWDAAAGADAGEDVTVDFSWMDEKMNSLEDQVEPIDLRYDDANGLSEVSWLANIFGDDGLAVFFNDFDMLELDAPAQSVADTEEIPRSLTRADRWRWPYNKTTGEKLPWSTPLGDNVVAYFVLCERWPFSLTTGKKLPLGTPLGDDVVTYKRLRTSWPYDKITGKKLPLGTPLGDNVVTYNKLEKLWPYDKTTGERLTWGTKLGGDVVTYCEYRALKLGHEATSERTAASAARIARRAKEFQVFKIEFTDEHGKVWRMGEAVPEGLLVADVPLMRTGNFVRKMWRESQGRQKKITRCLSGKGSYHGRLSEQGLGAVVIKEEVTYTVVPMHAVYKDWFPKKRASHVKCNQQPVEPTPEVEQERINFSHTF